MQLNAHSCFFIIFHKFLLMMNKYLHLFALAFCLFACNPESHNTASDQNIESRIDQLMSEMTFEEKLGQTALRGTSSRVKGALPQELKDAVRKGEIGAFLNVMKPEYVDELQRIAIEESPNGIPLIFARDIIHGFKTIFPIPLGMAASWDAEVAKNSARVSAIEAAEKGVRWTFSPMLDISRDARWGRIAESPGEDPYLASILAKGYIDGYQGEDLSAHNSMIACAKHFLAYGAAEGGRDYNTTIVNEELLRNVYLPPFDAAIDAGAQSVMSSFNDINGIPATGNKFILKTLLRNEMDFDGFVVSDWNSVTEMIPHGYAANEKHAAERAAVAGMDMEMTSKAYENHLRQLIDEGRVSMEELDAFVRNILRVKIRMGLFETPYRKEIKQSTWYCEDHLQKAKDAAIQSMVLLKNNNILPLSESKKIFLTGPLADAPLDQMGTWTFDGDQNYSQTPKMAFSSQNSNATFFNALDYSRDQNQSKFSQAVSKAKASEVIIFVGGEEAILSGEAHSRADISLPGAQEAMIETLHKTGKPIVLVLMAGRPISLGNIIDKVDAIVMAWHPGTMAGPAIYDLLYGEAQPEGRLPISWPKLGAQCPIYYNHPNTGRPASASNFVGIDDIPVQAWQSSLGNNSHYLDLGFEPEFPFGFGLHYGDVSYEVTKASSDVLLRGQEINISCTITNQGSMDCIETAQLYVQDVVGDIVRPVRELKGFRKIALKKGESKAVNFTISEEDLKYYNSTMEHQVEDGKFNVWIAPNAEEGLKTSFVLK